jgi:membrane protein YdbS with pleckstrin-like domain
MDPARIDPDDPISGADSRSDPEPVEITGTLKVTDLFSTGAPQSAGWMRVDPALGTYWRLILYVNALILCGIGIAAWFVLDRSGNRDLTSFVTPLSVSLFFALLLIVIAWLSHIIRRRVASIGYRLQDRELEVSSGILFQKLVTVPFARLQLVEVTAGPLERLLGIAGVQLHTASASTNAKISGLTPERALILRDSLNKSGEQAGL